MNDKIIYALLALIPISILVLFFMVFRLNNQIQFEKRLSDAENKATQAFGGVQEIAKYLQELQVKK
jgi:hypothetical protein